MHWIEPDYFGHLIGEAEEVENLQTNTLNPWTHIWWCTVSYAARSAKKELSSVSDLTLMPPVVTARWGLPSVWGMALSGVCNTDKTSGKIKGGGGGGGVNPPSKWSEWASQNIYTFSQQKYVSKPIWEKTQTHTHTQTTHKTNKNKESDQ